MAATHTLLYLETCLPDYFQGFSGHTFAVPLSSRPRFGEVLKSLHGEIGASQLDGPDFDSLSPAQIDALYASLHEQADALFAGFDKRTSYASHYDLSESYAYFGVKA
jgi:hypothetical protein